MEIQINSKPLCSVQISVEDICELLKDQSITYQMNEKIQVLNLISPFQGQHIYLENANKSLPYSVLEKVYSQLVRLGFNPILIQDEEDKIKHFNHLYEDEKQNLWLSFLNNEQKSDGISVYYSFNQVKSSKHLANLLIQNIARYSGLPINGTFFEWKNLMNSIFTLSNAKQNISTVVIVGSELGILSGLESKQLTESIAHALAAFNNQRPFVDLAYYFLAQKVNPSVIREAVSELTKEKPVELVKEQDTVASNTSTPVQSDSTLAWVYQQMANTPANQQQQRTIPSFIGYINKLSQLENPPKHHVESSPVNMLTFQRRK